MQEDLEDEVEAINAIFGEGTLLPLESNGLYALNIPSQEASLRIEFPSDYPHAPPSVLGTQRSGEHTRKGEAAHILDLFRDAVGRLWQPGQVCLFDVLEDLATTLPTAEMLDWEGDVNASLQATTISDANDSQGAPPWIISKTVVELKSVFVARCAAVSSPQQAKQYLHHLLDTDKKVAKATHNITAHRIRGEKGVTFQDCDDGGETAAGGRLLHLLQLMDAWDLTVVVTRWYGGQKLGPARFGIINGVARDALLRAGYVGQESAGAVKKKGNK